MKPYPPGIDLIQNGKCPAGATSPMACMFCQAGHMTECHFPHDCAEAQCGHYEAEAALDPYMVAEWEDEDPDEPACEICGCTEYHACPGGCGWSERFRERGRFVCTSCDRLMIMLEINLAAFRLFLDGKLALPAGRHA